MVRRWGGPVALIAVVAGALIGQMRESEETTTPLPSIMTFERVQTEWQGSRWVITEEPIMHSKCTGEALMTRKFVLRNGIDWPALPEATGDEFASKPVVNLAGIKPGRLGKRELRYRPPPDAEKYIVEPKIPTGACAGSWAANRPLLLLDVPPRPGAAMLPEMNELPMLASSRER